jgi:spore coat protein U domain-containing protein, fimbrial subunit CupE1/2/3/6
MHTQIRARLIVSLALLLAAAAPRVAHAAICNIAGSTISFGTYDPFTTQPRDSNTTIEVRCSGSNETVFFSLMATSGYGTFANRQAHSGTTVLAYNLFIDVGRTQIWGDGSQDTAIIQDSITITSTPVSKNYVIYGRIPGPQSSAIAASYSDDLTVTVRY